MTVSRHRRRMTTTRAIAASIVGLAVAAGLGAAGYVAIANTTDGQVVSGGPPEVTFPATPTAAVAVVDEAGNLASVAVLAVRPGDDDERRGGTVVPVPISADSSGGFGTERTPLNETVALFGPETLADEVPALLGVGIDELIVVDEGELAELLAPIGVGSGRPPGGGHGRRRQAGRPGRSPDPVAGPARRDPERDRPGSDGCRSLPDRRRRVGSDRRRRRRRAGDAARRPSQSARRRNSRRRQPRRMTSSAR